MWCMRNVTIAGLLAAVSSVAACDDKPTPKNPDEKPVAPAQTTPANKPVESKPAENKPVENKPAENKPADSTPADKKPAEGTEVKKSFATPQPTLETVDVKLDGKTFKLELAATDEQRFRGLSGRTEIAADGGMLFTFQRPSRQNFVMRDCPIAIDIIYVDATGRITAMHHMQPEAERSEEEKVLPEDARIPVWARTNDKYEERLKKYSSKFDAIIVIELRANTLNIEGSNPKGLNLKVGQKLDLDMAALRKRAK